MMPRINLTNRFIESVQVDIRTDFRDGIMPGLVLRVTPFGVKSWNLIYVRKEDGRKRRMTFGRHPALSLADARDSALKELGRIAEGGDPANKRRYDLTVQDLGKLFIDKYARRHKRTWAEDERILKSDVYPIIGWKLLNKVTRRDVVDILDAKIDSGAEIMSNRVLATVRKMFNWAEQEEYVEISPTARVKPRAKPVSRDRVLNNDEIKLIWENLETANMFGVTKDVIRLLLLTGQRGSEVSGMLKSEIDTERREWHLPKERVKNGRQHIVPLSRAAWAIVEPALDRLEFAADNSPLWARNSEPLKRRGVSNAVRRNQDHFGIDKWVPHDLRRTAATQMAEIGIQPHIIEALLNHISGARAGVAGIYNRAAYGLEKRQAVERWALRLTEIQEGKSSKVVAFSVNGEIA